MKLLTEEKKTKLQEEFDGFSDAVKNFKWLIVDGYRSNPPPAILVNLLDRAIHSNPLVWFMAGMSLEALGIAIQMILRIDSYPILDAVFAGVIAIALYLYQKREATKQCSKE